MQCTCSLRQSLGHTLSLNIINYAYVTVIIKWKFYAWLEPTAVKRLRVLGDYLLYQGAFVLELRLLPAVLAEIKVLVVVVFDACLAPKCGNGA